MKRPLRIGIALLFMAGYLFACAPPPAPAAEATPVPAPSPSPTPAATLKPAVTPTPSLISMPLPTPELLRVPVSVKLDPLDIEIEIVALGLDEEGRMDVPESAELASWYMEGPWPGQEGNALLAGHVAWKKQRGKFAYIKQLNIGDMVTITFEDGGTDVFEVASKESYLIADVPESVMDLSGESRVTMITCDGAFDREQGTSEARCIVILKYKETLVPAT